MLAAGNLRVPTNTELVGKRVKASDPNDMAVLGCVAVNRYEPKEPEPYKETVETLFEMALNTQTAVALNGMAEDVMPLMFSLNDPPEGASSIFPMAALREELDRSMSFSEPLGCFSSKRKRRV
jgi:hypothetical protein